MRKNKEWELQHGLWQEVFAKRFKREKPDAIITDPPYTERVMLGYRSGSDVDYDGRKGVFNIPYASWTEAQARELMQWTVENVQRWGIFFNDHIGARWISESLTELGWYVFAPLPWVRTNPPPRFAGDGPTGSTEWIVVARPKGKMDTERMGSRPGHYICAAENVQHQMLIGQKPMGLMRALVRDYTLRGDLIAEPFAGSGTTLLAAAIEGRRCVGVERDEATFNKASERLARGYTPNLFAVG